MKLTPTHLIIMFLVVLPTVRSATNTNLTLTNSPTFLSKSLMPLPFMLGVERVYWNELLIVNHPLENVISDNSEFNITIQNNTINLTVPISFQNKIFYEILSEITIKDKYGRNIYSLIRLRIINLGVYIPLTKTQVGYAPYLKPFFAMEGTAVVGVRYWWIIILTIIIWLWVKS